MIIFAYNNDNNNNYNPILVSYSPFINLIFFILDTTRTQINAVLSMFRYY